MGGAALPTTTRTGRPRERRDPRASRAMQQGVATMDTDTSRPSLAATGDSKTVRQTPAPALAAGPFVLSGGAIGAPATRRLSGCTQHIGTRRPACTDSASYVSSACLLSGTGSRFGTSGTCPASRPPGPCRPPGSRTTTSCVCFPLTRQDTNDNGLTTSVTSRRDISRYPYRTETTPSRMSSSATVRYISSFIPLFHSFRIHSGPGFSPKFQYCPLVPIHAFTPAPAPADVLILLSRVDSRIHSGPSTC